MRTTAILNLKGGVAKTATTVNTAAILASDYHKRVLVVDADGQCNSTEFFGGCQAGRCTYADMLRRRDVNDPIRPSNFDGVDLLPADDSLMDLDLSAVKDQRVDVEVLRKKLHSCRRRYDFVLVDCPPAFNAASAAALLAADDVVIPIKLDAFSLRGMANIVRQIRNMQRLNPQLRVAGLLPTMAYKSAQLTEAAAALQATKLPIFPAVRRTPKVDDMTFAQTPLIVSSPHSAACIDYRRFVKAYLEGGEQNGRL